jgi:hypothetical protein
VFCSAFARQSGSDRPAGQRAGQPSADGYTQRDTWLRPRAEAFLLLGGVVADRLPRHQVIAAANALQAAAQGTSAALLLTGHAHIWQLAACAAGTGAGFCTA